MIRARTGSNVRLSLGVGWGGGLDGIRTSWLEFGVLVFFFGIYSATR